MLEDEREVAILEIDTFIRLKFEALIIYPKPNRLLPFVSARSAKPGPKLWLAGLKRPVAGSKLKTNPPDDEPIGMCLAD
jgi:hypothetical protein